MGSARCWPAVGPHLLDMHRSHGAALLCSVRRCCGGVEAARWGTAAHQVWSGHRCPSRSPERCPTADRRRRGAADRADAARTDGRQRCAPSDGGSTTPSATRQACPSTRQPWLGRADRPDRIRQDRPRNLGDRHVERTRRGGLGEARPVRHHRCCSRRKGRRRRVRSRRRHRASDRAVVTTRIDDHVIGRAANGTSPGSSDSQERRHQRRLLGRAWRKPSRRVHVRRRIGAAADRRRRSTRFIRSGCSNSQPG